MKHFILLGHLMLLASVISYAQTPLSMNGRLKLVGNQLSNECGNPVQLRGMSTHGIMAHQNCYTEEAVRVLAEDWKADLFRLAIYTETSGGTPGYVHGNKEFWNTWIDKMVQLTEQHGMYIIIDWHILADGNPNTYINEARQFFELMSSRYADKKHVIYEIANEPNGGVSWSQVKSYAETIIPIIRNNDPEGIILVGTPSWSSDIWSAINDPLTGSNAYNVMYTYHFYANTHGDRKGTFNNATSQVPIFVSEWGSVDASGDGGFNSYESDQWLNLMTSNNGNVTISHANWSFVDKAESASALAPNSCAIQDYSSLTTPGQYIYNKIRTADNFQACSSAPDSDLDGVSDNNDNCPSTPYGVSVNAQGCPDEGDSDNDGVVNYLDVCPGTASGATVNIHGCEIAQATISNACFGYNNMQGYVRTDFSEANQGLVPNADNDVYATSIVNEQLVVDVTNADPSYATMTFSIRQNGTATPVDIRAHPVINLDVYFQPAGGYSPSEVILDFQLEDATGNLLNADVLGNFLRPAIPLNQWASLDLDIENGYLKSTDAPCSGPQPCYGEDFDFSRLAKIHIWVNPNAGNASWTRDPFTGTWTIDNFSIGYDESSTATCTVFTDTDGDGVADEEDLCASTPSGEAVDTDGCADSQLDDDNDGINNSLDRCPGTTPGISVNSNGCSDDQLNADDDNDGVVNQFDLCANTPSGETVNTDGCAQSQLDDDNDGTPNGQDECPADPDKIAAGDCGCGVSEDDCEVDCAGVMNGFAYVDNCQECVGGTTGKEACIGDPYNGSPLTIPGIMEAEEFDSGGEGVAYHDTDASNNGGSGTRNNGVDLEGAEGSSTNFNLAYTEPGEWLNYAVDVQNTGTYMIHFRIASEQGNGSWHLELDGQTIAGTQLNSVNTTGWQTYQIVSIAEPVTLIRGLHNLTFVVDGSGFNLDYIDFDLETITGMSGSNAPSADIYPVPASDRITIEQEKMIFTDAVIMDITGNVVKKVSLKGLKEEYLLDDLAKGVYMIKLSGQGTSQVYRVIVQ